jgi:hypothetical protein
VLKESSTTHEVNIAELKRATTEAMHLVMDARGEVVHCVSAMQRSPDSYVRHASHLPSAAPDWVRELQREIVRLQQLPPQTAGAAAEVEAAATAHAASVHGQAQRGADAAREAKAEAEARRAAECAFEVRVRSEWARREASWEEKLRAWRAMQCHMEYIEQAWEEAQDWWASARHTIQLIDSLTVRMPSPPKTLK